MLNPCGSLAARLSPLVSTVTLGVTSATPRVTPVNPRVVFPSMEDNHYLRTEIKTL